MLGTFTNRCLLHHQQLFNMENIIETPALLSRKSTVYGRNSPPQKGKIKFNGKKRDANNQLISSNLSHQFVSTVVCHSFQIGKVV